MRPEKVTKKDLFPEEVYIDAFNSVYSSYDNFQEYIKNDADKSTGIVAKIGKHMKNLNPHADYKLDKVGVVRKLNESLEINHKNISQYDGFKELFTRINKMQKELNQKKH